MGTRTRDYAYESLADVTGSDPEVGRGQLNAALRDIRTQEPALASVENSYLLSAEIHDRAAQYKQVWPEIALTPTALAKHWTRLPEEALKLKRGGVNLHADPPSSLPPRSREGLAQARKAMETLWPAG